MTFYIIPIVEGQTEQRCLERLLHRVWAELLGRSERLQVMQPFRGQRDTLVHASGKVLTKSVLKASLKLQAKQRQDAGARSLLLILLDAEGDCPATLAPRLAEVAHKALPPNSAIACVRGHSNWTARCKSVKKVNPDAGSGPGYGSGSSDPRSCRGSCPLSVSILPFLLPYFCVITLFRHFAERPLLRHSILPFRCIS